MSRNRYLSGLRRVAELAMASALGDLVPAILLDQTKLHPGLSWQISA
jgi:hypothetical protein